MHYSLLPCSKKAPMYFKAVLSRYINMLRDQHPTKMVLVLNKGCSPLTADC